MTGITHQHVQSNGIRMHVAEAGQGPLVVLLHGFPELWYSWRHQLAALAAAGYYALAPDLRGYGGTATPEPVEAYTMLKMTADVICPGCGHWTQQERSDDVNAELIDFLQR